MTKPPRSMEAFILELNQRLREMRQEHSGSLPDSEEIASELNYKDFHTFRGRKWDAATVRKYLSSKAYNKNMRRINEYYDDRTAGIITYRTS